MTDFRDLFNRILNHPACPIVLISILHLILFIAFYGKFGDLIIDSSRDATHPIRLLSGEVLYKDFHYEYGPLVPYFFALLYKIFGVHLIVLQLAGLISSILISTLLFKCAHVFLSRGLSLFLAVFYIGVFAFQYYLVTANIFNFIYPYSYSATFGVLIFLGGLYVGWRIIDSGKTRDHIFFGLLLGFASINKIETFAASLVLFALLYTVLFIRELRSPTFQNSLGSLFKNLLFSLLSLGAIVIPVFLYFSSHLDYAAYLTRELSSHGASQTALDFHKRVMGVKEWWPNLKISILSFLLYVGLGYCFVVSDKFYEEKFSSSQTDAQKNIVLWGITGILVALGAFITVHTVGLGSAFRGLNLMNLTLLGSVVVSLFRGWKEKKFVSKELFLFLIAVSGWVFLFRKILHLVASHYGFYILIPGIILFFVFVFNILPKLLGGLKNEGKIFRLGFVLFLTIIGLDHFILTSKVYESKQFTIESDRGKWVLPMDEAKAMVELKKYFAESNIEKPDLMMVPEGYTINYMYHSSPRFYYNSSVLGVGSKAQQEIFLKELSEKKPQYLLLTSHPFLKVNSIRRILKFIKQNYSEDKFFGAKPYNERNQFGMLLFRRKT